jgi:hypothetical protein
MHCNDDFKSILITNRGIVRIELKNNCIDGVIIVEDINVQTVMKGKRLGFIIFIDTRNGQEYFANQYQSRWALSYKSISICNSYREDKL